MTLKKLFSVFLLSIFLVIGPCLIEATQAAPQEVTTKPRQISRSPVPRTVFQPDVCSDPKAPCNSTAKQFAPFELSFRLPSKLTRGRNYESLPFYAVMLKTSADSNVHCRLCWKN